MKYIQARNWLITMVVISVPGEFIVNIFTSYFLIKGKGFQVVTTVGPCERRRQPTSSSSGFRGVDATVPSSISGLVAAATDTGLAARVEALSPGQALMLLTGGG